MTDGKVPFRSGPLPQRPPGSAREAGEGLHQGPLCEARLTLNRSVVEDKCNVEWQRMATIRDCELQPEASLKSPVFSTNLP